MDDLNRRLNPKKKKRKKNPLVKIAQLDTKFNDFIQN